MSLPMPKYAHLPHPKDKPRVVLLEDYPYGIDQVIPRGYMPDGSTQFSLVHGLIQFGLGSFGEHDPAWLWHDWEYEHNGNMPDGTKLTRKEIDLRFKRRLKEAGVHRKRIDAAYFFVRKFGWIPWMMGDGKPKIMSEAEMKKRGL